MVERLSEKAYGGTKTQSPVGKHRCADERGGGVKTGCYDRRSRKHKTREGGETFTPQTNTRRTHLASGELTTRNKAFVRNAFLAWIAGQFLSLHKRVRTVFLPFNRLMMECIQKMDSPTKAKLFVISQYYHISGFLASVGVAKITMSSMGC